MKPVGNDRIEWITVAVAAACYIVWGLATALAPIPLAIPLLALAITLHSSLSHEVIHGHPFRSPWLSEALVFPALGLLVPYQRFRDTHLAHHKDANLTDPYDDPETAYLDPKFWDSLPGWAQRLFLWNNTLLGRIVIGPIISTLFFFRDDWRMIRAGSHAVRRAWLFHALGLIPVVLWLLATGFPLWAYLIAAYLGNAILRIRTFAEHQAHPHTAGRTAIVEDRGALAFLFLNNNFHAVHHMEPSLPWYALQKRYFADRDRFLARNFGYRYSCYGQVIRTHAFRRKEPVAHPLYRP